MGCEGGVVAAVQAERVLGDEPSLGVEVGDGVVPRVRDQEPAVGEGERVVDIVETRVRQAVPGGAGVGVEDLDRGPRRHDQGVAVQVGAGELGVFRGTGMGLGGLGRPHGAHLARHRVETTEGRTQGCRR